MKLTVATRGSVLALWQTHWVIDRLREHHGGGLEVEILTIRTQGDRQQDVPIYQIGGKGIFVKEIEQALLDGTADFAVHSLKDMPGDQPPGLSIAAVPEREDPRDALVLPANGGGIQSFADSICPPLISGEGSGMGAAPGSTPSAEHPTPTAPDSLSSLPNSASVGTTSRRRGALLRHDRPDLRVEMLRGNLDTRLRKLDEGQFDAAVLAAAGLRRLGYGHRISVLLPSHHFVPCAGQGALAIEARETDEPVRALLAPLEHSPTRQCVTAERTVLRRMGGSCHTPLGAHAVVDGDELVLHGMVASPDGTALIRRTTRWPANDPEGAGHRLADLLIETGGDRILEAIKDEEASG